MMVENVRLWPRLGLPLLLRLGHLENDVRKEQERIAIQIDWGGGSV